MASMLTVAPGCLSSFWDATNMAFFLRKPYSVRIEDEHMKVVEGISAKDYYRSLKMCKLTKNSAEKWLDENGREYFEKKTDI
ncbi:hypothetical protein OESDEN_08554, partial [Oesophagostomum dentatum]